MNSTTERTQTAAEARKAKAEVTLKQLQSEREHILTQQKTAQETIERVNGVMGTAGRSGEADTLNDLRSDRRAAEESIRDLERALPAVDRDLQLAEGERHAATVQLESERYNALQGRQAALLQTIAESIDMIVEAVAEKEELAIRQNRILANVRSGGNQNPANIRHELGRAIAGRLQGLVPTPLKTLDWSSWPMTEGGDLLR